MAAQVIQTPLPTEIKWQPPKGRWFGHNDFDTREEHDIDCRTGGAWPSRHEAFAKGNGLTKEQVMQTTWDLVKQNPKEIVCEIVHWAHGYSWKAWKVDDSAVTGMNFVRGSGDHALVYSMGQFRLKEKIERSCWEL